MKAGGQVPQEFIETFQENFNLVDEDRDGYIGRADAMLLLRGLGQAPPESEAETLKKGLPEKIDFAQFLAWFSKVYTEPCTEQQIVKAFRVFDLSSSGVLPVSKFRELLNSVSIPLKPDEMNEILAEVPVDSRGNFDYVTFARKLVEGPKGCAHLISKGD